MLLEELKKFQYWNEINKRTEDLYTGKRQFHELIEVYYAHILGYKIEDTFFFVSKLIREDRIKQLENEIIYLKAENSHLELNILSKCY